ncbi:MAG: 50S ribosomal protein L23 [Candidatus Babeliaceae bacterium]
MDLNIYSIIKRPRLTNKVYMLNRLLKQLVLEVHPQANKPMIAEALKKLFKVEVEKIRIIVSKGKNRRMGRHAFTGQMKKKAIVTLKKGYSIDQMDLTTLSVPSETTAQAA